jgi:glucan phosphoethanolaminetransferase (alkaline phosphatase superfamily)
MSKFNVPISTDTVINVLETDWNEAGELINWELFLYIGGLGVLPCFLLTKITISDDSKKLKFLTAGGCMLSLFYVGLQL